MELPALSAQTHSIRQAGAKRTWRGQESVGDRFLSLKVNKLQKIEIAHVIDYEQVMR
jgi:hypothetical protein